MVNPLSLLHSVLALYFDDPGTLSCREWERREREKAIKRQREKARKRESEKGDTIEAVERRTKNGEPTLSTALRPCIIL